MNQKTLQTLRPMLIFSGIVILIMFALSAYTWMQIPADVSIPVHFDAAGQPDRYGGKFEGLMLLPIIVVAITALLAATPKLDPHGENILRSRTAFFATWGIILLFMLFIHVAIILSVLGYGVNLFSVMPIGLGLLFIVLGNYMGKVRHNYMFGIRTPWTLASERSWNKTHRLGGKLFMGLGLLFMLSIFFLPADVWAYVLLISVFTVVFGLMAYSYIIWRQDQRPQNG